jgi:hypothetical protein
VYDKLTRFSRALSVTFWQGLLTNKLTYQDSPATFMHACILTWRQYLENPKTRPVILQQYIPSKLLTTMFLSVFCHHYGARRHGPGMLAAVFRWRCSGRRHGRRGMVADRTNTACPSAQLSGGTQADHLADWARTLPQWDRRIEQPEGIPN